MIENKDIIRFTIPLTLKCNLKCSYCHVPNNKNKILDFEIFKKSINFFFSSKGVIKNLILYGGELLLIEAKLLNKYINYIYKEKQKYKNKNIDVSIISNLTILNPEIEKILKKIDSISVSLDGNKKSHNINRGLFDITYKNLKKLEKNPSFEKKISINKVVNKKNVYNVLDDFKYLLNNFSCKIYYNNALTVGDWDNNSVSELKKQISLIYEYVKINKLQTRLGNFFRIPLECCPFGTLSLGLDGKIYNCEFIANDYINKHGAIIDLFKNKLIKTNIKNCKFDVSSEKCNSEVCMDCNSFCTKFSFQKNKKLDNKSIKILKEVRKTRFNHIYEYKKYITNKYKQKLNILFIIDDYKEYYKIYNLLHSLNKMLGVIEYNIKISSKKQITEKIIKNFIQKLNTKKICNIKLYFHNKSVFNYELKVDINTGYIFNNNGKLLGNIVSEFDLFS